MEVRDIIPSQSSVPVYKNSEEGGARFRTLMAQKFSGQRHSERKDAARRDATDLARQLHPVAQPQPGQPQREIGFGATRAGVSADKASRSDVPRLEASKRDVSTRDVSDLERDRVAVRGKEAERADESVKAVQEAVAREPEVSEESPVGEAEKIDNAAGAEEETRDAAEMNLMQSPIAMLSGAGIDVETPNEENTDAVRSGTDSERKPESSEFAKSNYPVKGYAEEISLSDAKQYADSEKLLEMVYGVPQEEGNLSSAQEEARLEIVSANPKSKMSGQTASDPGANGELPKAAEKARSSDETPQNILDRVKMDLGKEMKAEARETEGRSDTSAFSKKADETANGNRQNAELIDLPLKSEAVQHRDMMLAKATRPINRQVNEAIVADLKILSGGKTLEVTLTPEHLGKISMKLESQEGGMVANIKVENSQVKNALEASIQELRETLQQKGITVKEIHVSVSKDEHRGGQEYSGNRNRDEDEDEGKKFVLNPDEEVV